MGTTADKLQKILDSKNAIKLAIEAKGVQDVGDVLAEYPQKIESIQTSGDTGYTGHVDIEGLKAIGWTDEDIEYFQKNGVDWNEEEDEYYKVPQDNIDLYGTITIDNIADYKDILVYLPKIDTSEVTNMSSIFQNCRRLIAVPYFDTSKATNFSYLFSGCVTLKCIPLLDTSKATKMSNMFSSCTHLKTIPLLNTASVTYFPQAFSGCCSLEYLPNLDFTKAEEFESMFNGCYSLKEIPSIQSSSTKSLINFRRLCENCYELRKISFLDITKTSVSGYLSETFHLAYNLQDVLLKGLCINVSLSDTSSLSKESLLYMIENATPTSAITITLHSNCYNKYNADPDITAALSAQPLVSLASA